MPKGSCPNQLWQLTSTPQHDINISLSTNNLSFSLLKNYSINAMTKGISLIVNTSQSIQVYFGEHPAWQFISQNYDGEQVAHHHHQSPAFAPFCEQPHPLLLNVTLDFQTFKLSISTGCFCLFW